jgi:phospholipid/cholesterol/gamma-HCH transport system substrate-binding protein
MKSNTGYQWKLGMFVVIALVAFAVTIYFVGKQKNLFGSTFLLKAQFKTVSGLKVGNNVRFSGINIGTVDNIQLITDTSVLVGLIIQKEIQPFIKKDAKASIGSDGLMGDKVLTIFPGNPSGTVVKDNDMIASKNPIEMDDVMNSVKASVDNAGIITAQLAQFSYKMNNGNGALSKLISDEGFSNSLKNTLTNLQNSTGQFAKFTTKINDGKLGKALDSTMVNVQNATKGLNENMEAAKNNILLRGYFRKKKKADAKKAADVKKQEAINKKKGIITPTVNKKDTIKQ